MNFLLHFHVAHAQASGPHERAFALGAMLPDLWRMAARPARARRVAEATTDALVAEVQRGVQHHLAVDRWFHASPHFTRGEALASDALRATGSARIALFGHVVWEMCLDGALLRARGVERVARELASALAADHLVAAGRSADLHHGEARARAGVAEEVFAARMARLFAALSSFELPRGYADAEGTALRLAGVRAALGLPRATPDELARWADAIAAIHEAADRTVGDLVSDALARPPDG